MRLVRPWWVAQRRWLRAIQTHSPELWVSRLPHVVGMYPAALLLVPIFGIGLVSGPSRFVSLGPLVVGALFVTAVLDCTLLFWIVRGRSLEPIQEGSSGWWAPLATAVSFFLVGTLPFLLYVTASSRIDRWALPLPGDVALLGSVYVPVALEGREFCAGNSACTGIRLDGGDARRDDEPLSPDNIGQVSEIFARYSPRGADEVRSELASLIGGVDMTAAQVWVDGRSRAALDSLDIRSLVRAARVGPLADLEIAAAYGSFDLREIGRFHGRDIRRLPEATNGLAVAYRNTLRLARHASPTARPTDGILANVVNGGAFPHQRFFWFVFVFALPLVLGLGIEIVFDVLTSPHNRHSWARIGGTAAVIATLVFVLGPLQSQFSPFALEHPWSHALGLHLTLLQRSEHFLLALLVLIIGYIFAPRSGDLRWVLGTSVVLLAPATLTFGLFGLHDEHTNLAYVRTDEAVAWALWIPLMVLALPAVQRIMNELRAMRR